VLAGDDLDVTFSIRIPSITIPAQGYPSIHSTAFTVTNDGQTEPVVTILQAIMVNEPTWVDGAGNLLPIPVQAATIFLPHTYMLTAQAGIMRSLSDPDSVAAILGKVVPNSQLAYGVDKALKNAGGQTVYFASIVSDDLTGYEIALGDLEGVTEAYMIVPMSNDPAVLDAVNAHVQAESSATQQNECRTFVATDLPLTIVTYDKQPNGNNWLGYVAIAPGTNPAQYSRLTVPGANFIEDGVRAGDQLRTNFGVDASGAISYQTALVNSVIDAENIVLANGGFSDAVGAVGDLRQIQIVRVLTQDERAALEATKSNAFNNVRVHNVFADFQHSVPDYYVAAAVAGLASSVAPHQPITNYTVIGFSDATGSQKRFTPTQLNTMAAGGTLIVTQARAGGQVYVRHQLTTDNTDDNSSELSIQRNADSLCRYFRDLIKVFVGTYNISDNFLILLDVMLRHNLNQIQNTIVTQSAGPQITSWSNLVVSQDDVVKTEVDMSVDCVGPKPANQLKLKLRVS
jgi:hypothetical protein